HHVLHGVATRQLRDQCPYQEPRQRRVAVGKMIDVGLADTVAVVLRQAKTDETRIAERTRVLGRDRIRAKPVVAERPALEAVRRLLGAAANLDEIVAIAGALEQSALFVDALAMERIALGVVERDQLLFAR